MQLTLKHKELAKMDGNQKNLEKKISKDTSASESCNPIKSTSDKEQSQGFLEAILKPIKYLNSKNVPIYIRAPIQAIESFVIGSALMAGNFLHYVNTDAPLHIRIPTYTIEFFLGSQLISSCVYNIKDLLFDFDNFVVPNDLGFLKLYEELSTLEDIFDYMSDFKYVPHYGIALSPYETYLSGEADCDDYATFATYFANYLGYPSYKIVTKDENNSNHMLGAYEVENSYRFSDNYYLSPSNLKFKSFEEIVEYDTELNASCNNWVSYQVFDYNNNLVEELFATKNNKP